MWIALRCVFCVRAGIYIHIVWMFGKCLMGYEYFMYSIDMCVYARYFKCIFLAFANL